MKMLLGGKGANLAEMTNIGLPVPPGFTITTEMCTYFRLHGGRYPAGFRKNVLAALRRVERLTGKKFGDPKKPLLVSVRSGAPASMPGMMDTILNLGLNDATVKGLIAATGNERFAYDSYRRLVQMYGDVVLGLKPASENDRDPFELIIERKKSVRGIRSDTELTAEDLRDLTRSFQNEIHSRLGVPFPQDPHDQLWGAIDAVFRSWMNERAIAYRKLNTIPGHWGTAVNVQAMVFGNMGDNSGTGVAFTRNPATGENQFYGEFLMNAQGEDVVAGIRTPIDISTIVELFPKIYNQLLKVRSKLERHYRDMQDFEFTIEQGKLYMLQTRNGKRTGIAALRIAVEMVGDKLIKPAQAVTRVEPEQLNQLLRPVFDSEEKERALKEGRLLAKGLNAGPGAATGKAVFSATEAEEWKRRGEQVILVRMETSPEDIKGMDNASDTLYRLKPVTYRYKKEIDRNQALDYGLIAEEVAEVDPNLALRNGKGEIESVRYNAINVMLLNEFRKAHKAFVEEQGKVKKLEAELAGLLATVKEQAAQIEKVSAQVQISKPAPRVVANKP